ncbi:MAG: serpin family protein [Chlamydiota bacterium]
MKHFLIAICALLPFSSLRADDSEAISQLVKDHTEFALAFYPKLQTSSPNFICSPNSIATTLTMVAIGARGDTETELMRVLRLSTNRKALAKSTFLLSESLFPKKTELGSYDLNIANALWVDRATFLLADFRYAIEQLMKGKLTLLNFAEPGNAVASINAWTQDQTKGKIRELMSADSVNAMTRLVLTSAIYFQGAWRNPFDSKSTEMLPFFHTPDASSNAPMLKQTNLFPYFDNDLVQMAALPFQGASKADGTIAYIMLLPKSAENFDAMLQELPSHFSEWMSALKMQRLDLTMPKFKFSSRFQLNKALQNMGAENAFTTSANFSGIDGMRDLFLSSVFHETLVDLDENGITAAAATAAVINVKSTAPTESPITFNANHPFFFFIVDLKSQEILFLGKYAQVSDTQPVSSTEIEERADVAIADPTE